MPRSSRSASLQHLCAGCQKIETDLIREWRRCQAKDEDFRGSKECLLHDSYQDVEVGARSGCLACRACRRSLLQRQFTTQAACQLVACTGPVRAKLSHRNGPPGADFLLEITVHPGAQDDHTDEKMAAFVCTNDANLITRKVACNLPGNPEHDSILQQVRGWMQKCHEEHYDCCNLRWSNRNPTNLIEILPNNRLRLINPPEKPLLKYSALSYSWGRRDQMSVDDAAQIKNAETRRKDDKNGWRANIKERRDRFRLSDLSEVMRDAIRLSSRLDIPYVWIDQVCIGDAADWNVEASKMREVYGNAHVTICACASDKASARLFSQRSAWEYSEEPCILEGLQLVEYDVPLEQVRMVAPIFRRAWILQEERLSPRCIYWCSQQVYWSCLQSPGSEVSSDAIGNTTARLTERFINIPPLLSPQGFMAMQWKGEATGLHDEWLDLVQDFTRRAIFDPADTFPAMSGLAVQYLQAFTRENRVSRQQEYLAGLWRQTFARDLAWSVKIACDAQHQHRYAPRWSWASLPSETLINTKCPFEICADFQLLEPSRVKSGDSAFEVVYRGAAIDAVRVKGRLRKFGPRNCKIVNWHDIVDTDHDPPKFKLHKVGSDGAVAQHFGRGQILTYEDKKEQVIAQLDYDEDHGDLRELYCLEVGKSTMLILLPASRSRTVGVPSFVRIGASHDYRPNFFNDLVPVQELDLVARSEPARAGVLGMLTLCAQWMWAMLKLLFMW